MGQPKKKDVIPMYQCKLCGCGPFAYNKATIVRHNKGEKHQRLARVHANRGLLEKKFIFFNEEIGMYTCQICKQVMDICMDKMLRHHRDEHILKEGGCDVRRVLEVSKTYRPNDFYDKVYKLESDVENFTTIDTSVTIKESSWNVVGILRTCVVPIEEAPRLYCMASILERFGKLTNRGKKVGGSRMVMYGYFEFGQLGCFVHPNRSLYDLSEKFASEMATYFQLAFPGAMARFDKILSNEGLSSGESRFANTPFTCFSVTRDYKCRPHGDPSDYGYGIIVWLYPDEGLDIEDFPTIWLPQYHIRFSPRCGTAIVLNCNNTIHSTTRKKCVGALGMAFVMKRNFITQLKVALENPLSKVALNFHKAKAKYEEEKSTYRGRHVAAPFYS